MIQLTVNRAHVKILTDSTNYDFLMTSEIKGLSVKPESIILTTPTHNKPWVEIKLADISTYNGGSVPALSTIAANLQSVIGGYEVRSIAGLNGERYIPNTTLVACRAIAVKAMTDMVLESVIDENDVERIGANDFNYGGVTIAADRGYLWFGFITKSIKLASGTAEYLKAE